MQLKLDPEGHLHFSGVAPERVLVLAGQKLGVGDDERVVASELVDVDVCAGSGGDRRQRERVSQTAPPGVDGRAVGRARLQTSREQRHGVTKRELEMRVPDGLR